MSESRKLHLTVSLSGVLEIEKVDNDFTVTLASTSYATHGNLSNIDEFDENVRQEIGQTARELLLRWLTDHLRGVKVEAKLPQFNTPSGGAMA